MNTGITGPEGAGKTMLMTYFGLLHLSKGGKVYTFPGYDIVDLEGKKLSEPLPMEKWVTLPDDLRDVLICIDEIQNFFGSDRYMTWINKIFVNIARQRRHRSLGIMYTLQDWGDLDPRIRDTTAVLISCTDAYWSRAGKADGLVRGDIIDYNVVDVKGFFTGHPWTLMSRRKIGSKARPARLIVGPHYNSYSDVDIWAGLTQIDIKKPKLTIDLTDGQEPPKKGKKAVGDISSGAQSLVDQLAEVPGMNSTLLRKTAEALRDSGGETE